MDVEEPPREGCLALKSPKRMAGVSAFREGRYSALRLLVSVWMLYIVVGVPQM